jgi:hypothetical protein
MITGHYGNGYVAEEDAYGNWCSADDVADLEAKLAEVERENEELRQKYEDTMDGAAKVALMAEKRVRDAEAERDEAKRVAVWAARGEWGLTQDGRELVSDDYSRTIEVDGTDADVYRALKEAKLCK